MNDDAVYESADFVIGISTEDESATYTSLKENKERENVYQSLQPPGTSAVLDHTKGGDDQKVEYENPVFKADFHGD